MKAVSGKRRGCSAGIISIQVFVIMLLAAAGSLRAQSCTHSICLYDSGSDGWEDTYWGCGNDARVEVYVDGSLIITGTITLFEGIEKCYNFSVSNGQSITVEYFGGCYPTENSYAVFNGPNGTGTELFRSSGPPSSPQSITPSCSVTQPCPAPVNLSLGNAVSGTFSTNNCDYRTSDGMVMGGITDDASDIVFKVYAPTSGQYYHGFTLAADDYFVFEISSRPADCVCPDDVGDDWDLSFVSTPADTWYEGEWDCSPFCDGAGFPVPWVGGQYYYVTLETSVLQNYDYTLAVFGPGSSVCGLPVTLIDASADCQNGYAGIQWSTASETNNDYFTILGSTDAVNFETVGKVDGQGNSNQIMNYTWTDENKEDEFSYYKLMQTDFDGSVKELAVLAPECNKLNSDNCHFQYNADNSSIEFYAENAVGNIIVYVYDYLGQLCSTREFDADTDEFSATIPAGGLSEGIYIVKAGSTHSSFTQKLMISH